MRAVIRAAARDDILRQYRYYLLQDAFGAAERFRRAVEQTIAELSGSPRAGAPRNLRSGALNGLRSWPVTGFEDTRAYYLIDGDRVRVVRVLHGRRDVQRILSNEEEFE